MLVVFKGFEWYLPITIKPSDILICFKYNGEPIIHIFAENLLPIVIWLKVTSW